MILSELYKVFIKQRIIFFLFALLILSYTYHVFAGYDTTDVISNSEAYYTSFLDKYEGKITKKKSKEIKNESETIEKDTGDTLANELEKQAFESFYHIYLYEKESGSGYLTDTRGWETILCHDNVNYFSVIFVVLLGVVLFETEYENEMNLIIVSTCGKNKLTKYKIFIGTIGSIAASVLFQFTHIVYLITSVGLKNANYPLKTIEFFQDTAYDITLGSALLFSFALNILGSMLLMSFVMLLAVLIKKKEISMVLSLLSVMLPKMIFSGNSTIYKIPWAASLLSANGFLWPDQYTHQVIENQLEKVLSFQATEKNYMLVILFVDIFLMILFSIIVFIKFSNYRPKKHKKLKLEMTIVCILICVCMTGCSSSNNTEEKVTIDGSLNGQISLTYDKYLYYIDQTENTVCREDEEENLIVTITKNVFPLSQTITNIFVDENYCYYLLENDDNTNITVHRIDLKSFEDILVYSTGSGNTEDFYGLCNDDSTDANEILENIATVKWFFVTNQFIYYQKGSCIYKCSRIYGNQMIIDSSVSDDEIRYQNGVLYYKDAYGNDASYHETSD